MRPFVCVSAREKGFYDLHCRSVSSPLVFGTQRHGQPLASLSDGCPPDPVTMSLAAACIAQSEHLRALNRAWSFCHVVHQSQPDDDEYEPARMLQVVPLKLSVLLAEMCSASNSADSLSAPQTNTN